MIRIDGSFGEGGGQILRSSLSLSMVTGQPFRMDKIRAGRERPGLLRQHLTAVRAAVEISGAQVEGASLGSTSLAFTPGVVRAGEYKFAVGTAGSATLVLQTILPPLMLAEGPSLLTLEGGTHNTAAPPFDFLERTFLPLVERMGPRVKAKLNRYGFYPAGGGSFTASIKPSVLVPLHLDSDRGEITSRRVRALAVNLPQHIVQRELDAADELLQWGRESCVWETSRESAGPGNVVMVEVGSKQVLEIFTAFGEKGRSSEQVGEAVALEVIAYMKSNAVCCEHLCDQLLLPMALAGGGSFTATEVSSHAKTNMEVIRQFLPRVRFEVLAVGGGVKIEVGS